MMLVPDSVYGAVLLSAIDFFLSFVVISGIGVVLAMFPYLNRLGQAKAETPVVFSMMPDRDVNAEHAAVIAAAVYTVLGAHRLVYVGEARRAAGWASDLRSRLHTSHSPRQGGR